MKYIINVHGRVTENIQVQQTIEENTSRRQHYNLVNVKIQKTDIIKKNIMCMLLTTTEHVKETNDHLDLLKINLQKKLLILNV